MSEECASFSNSYENDCAAQLPQLPTFLLSMASGAPALDLENYKKFYGFGIPSEFSNSHARAAASALAPDPCLVFVCCWVLTPLPCPT